MQQITAAPAASASRLTRTTRYTDVIRNIEGGLDALAAGRPNPPSLSNRGVHMVIRRISLEATGIFLVLLLFLVWKCAYTFILCI